MDANNKLSLQACMGLFQDIATEHCIPLGWEHSQFMANNNAFWVVTKIKLQIDQMPTSGDNVTIKTWMAKPTAVKFERNCSITKNKTPIVKAKMEWVVLDAVTHRPRGVKTINYPEGLKYLPQQALEDKFAQITLDQEATNKCLSRTIYYGDTDLNNHTNNGVYSRFVLDCFDTNFLKSNALTDYEIHFVNESHAGEVLDFYKQHLQNSEYLVEAKVKDKTIIKAKLTFLQV